MEKTYTLPRTALFFIGLAFVVVAFYLYYALNQNTSLKHLSGEVANFSRVAVVNSLEQFDKTGATANLVGAPVLLRSVKISSVVGDYIFILGEGDTFIPVVLLGEIAKRQKESVVEVEEGQTARVVGTLFELKDISAVVSPEYIDKERYDFLSTFKFFILAQRVWIEEGNL